MTPGFGQYFSEIFPEEAAELLREADLAINLIVDLLGSGPVDLASFKTRPNLKVIKGAQLSAVKPGLIGRIPWHFDVKSGIGWDPAAFYADIRYGEILGADIKVPWELSRCQHFVTLGQAYRLTMDEKYARCFVEQAQDWMDQNPVKIGVNWSSPMDVALRACNWLLALELFQGSSSVSNGFKERISATLWEHGRHVARHLEWGGRISTNHYISNLLGLAYLGKAFGHVPWERFASKEFQKEILSQTYDDGADFEGSTAYHKFVLEMFFFGSRMLDLKEAPFHARLRLMFQCLQQTMMSDGHIPLVGDNDSGRIHSLFRRPDSDGRALLNWGALHFKDHQLKVHGWEKTSDIAWLYGFSGYESFKAYYGMSSSEIPSKQPSSSGFLVLRGPNHYLSFSAQPNGTRGVGNHTHNDKLSFTLCVEGQRYFVDPGTVLYSSNPSMRNLFRSTAMHNTVQVDGMEQNEMKPDSLFSLGDDAEVSVHQFIPGRKINATHSGYERLADPVIHRRIIEKSDHALEWMLVDEFSGTGEHRFQWTFMLDPEIRVKRISPGQVTLFSKKGGLTFECLNPTMESLVEDVSVAPAYGVLQESKAIRFRAEGTMPMRVEFRIRFDEKLKER